jgi:N-methylhydantoinase B
MLDPIRIEIFKYLFSSVAEEMGVALRRSGHSPNIKERRDFSCALFDSAGKMVAQAAHMPVHLGAMPVSVQACLEAMQFTPGDVAILNDPFRGGTHLPDITLVAPIFDGRHLIGFAANRAHHSDVGGMSPGSMPLSQELYQEGLIIPPLKLTEGGRLNQGVMDLLLANVRTPEERAGDLRAQMAANRKGVKRVRELAARYGRDEISAAMQGLLTYAERMTRRMIADLPDGTFRFKDVMDNDGIDPTPVTIAVMITIHGDEVSVDFSSSSPQQRGCINATHAITTAATMYAFRCLMGLDIPSNSGCLVPIKIIAPEGTVVNARRPAAVAGGNVETSQRITDVLLGALAQICPTRVPAASQGTMNNLSIGGMNPRTSPPRPFAYYETVGGGMGARPNKIGADAIHTHMTNTLNTPVEALEYAYPLSVRRYEVRRGSGGKGRYRGGDGIIREIELLTKTQVTILSDRRQSTPYGLAGGDPGKCGRNLLLRYGEERELPGKTHVDAEKGDIISIHTPGGGGWGNAT